MQLLGKGAQRGPALLRTQPAPARRYQRCTAPTRRSQAQKLTEEPGPVGKGTRPPTVKFLKL